MDRVEYKPWLKWITAVFTLLAMIYTLLMPIEVNAADIYIQGGRGYSGHFDYTYTGTCIGVKRVVGYTQASDGPMGHVDDCHMTYDRYYRNISVWNGSGYYTASWRYGVQSDCHNTNGTCPYNGDDGYREGQLIYGCSECGAQFFDKNFETRACPGPNRPGVPANPTGRHQYYDAAHGCWFCETKPREIGEALCNKYVTLGIEGDWTNTVRYTFQQQAGSKTVSREDGTNNRIQLDYNTSATVTYTFTKAVESYQWYIDGVAQPEQMSNGDALEASITRTITNSGQSYQLKFKVRGGNEEILTSPIYLDCAVKLKVHDVVKSDFSNKNHSNDFVNGQEISENEGLFKVTDPSKGGDGTKHGPGETDTEYLKGWPINGTSSTTAKANEPYPGAGRNNTVNNYYPGYKYVGETDPIIIQSTNYFTDEMTRFFEPIEWTTQFNNNHSTGYIDENGNIVDGQPNHKLPDIDFTYDRWVKIPDNTLVRRYKITYHHNEPWITELASQNGRETSEWVRYNFKGWSQGNVVGTSPYYEMSSSSDVKFQDGEWIANLTITPGDKVQLNAVWQGVYTTLPSSADTSDYNGKSKNDYVFVDWSHLEQDSRLNNHTITNNVDPVGATVHKGQQYKPYADIQLYGHWYKDVTVTFDLNGGRYNGSTNNITSTVTVYDEYNQPHFNLDGTLSPAEAGNRDKQTVAIDGYGTYDADGINKVYTKQEGDTVCRFLGWSWDKNATEPLDEYNVFNPNRYTQLKPEEDHDIYSHSKNYTLYAVWEPVLTVTAEVYRSLGTIDYEDTSIQHALKIQNLTSANYTENVLLRTIVRPGEQGTYRLVTSGAKSDTVTSVLFDTTVTDIYDNGDSTSPWYDNLNPLTDNPYDVDQKHGLNRAYLGIQRNIQNKWYTPNYFGTDKSYETSVGKEYYLIRAIVSQPSVYYEWVYGREEQVCVTMQIDVTDKIPYDPDNPGSNPGTGHGPNGGDTTLDELRTRLKIRIL